MIGEEPKMFSTINEALDWLKDRATEKGHVELTDVPLDGDGDVALHCPYCDKTIWLHLTTEERRKYVFAVPHVCDRGRSVTFHIKRQRTAEEVLALWNSRFPDEPFELVRQRETT